MTSPEVLVFELSGEYGHFRKFNTTSSPLTYLIPTRLALVGLLGAIIGIERESSTGQFKAGMQPLNELFERSKTHFAIQILNPVKKVNIGFNLLDTGKSASSFFNIQQRTQIEFELLKDPRYRIFFQHEDAQLFEEISQRIQWVRHHFTPYLGLSQFTATVDWVGREILQREEGTEEMTDIITAINLSKLPTTNHIGLKKDGAYTTDTLPIAMQRDRIVTEYAEILVERNGRPLQLRKTPYWVSSFGKILWL